MLAHEKRQIGMLNVFGRWFPNNIPPKFKRIRHVTSLYRNRSKIIRVFLVLSKSIKYPLSVLHESVARVSDFGSCGIPLANQDAFIIREEKPVLPLPGIYNKLHNLLERLLPNTIKIYLKPKGIE
jgi:hypothetical protein